MSTRRDRGDLIVPVFHKEERAMRRTTASMICAFGIACLASWGTARAESPTLAELVPDTVLFHIQAQASKERTRLERPYMQALESLVQSGIGKDIFDLAMMDSSEGEKDQARRFLRGAWRLVTTPNWKELTAKEVAFAGRVAAPLPLPEYLVLFHVPADSVTARVGEFHQVFQKIAEFSQGRLSVTEEEIEGVKVVHLVIFGAPFTFSVAGHGEAVMLCSSEGLLLDVLRLAHSEDHVGSIAKSERFVQGVDSLSDPNDMQMFFDMTRYVGIFRNALTMAASQMGQDPNAQGAVRIFEIILNELGRLGSVTAVEQSQKDRRITEARMTFESGDTEAFFERLVREQRPLDNPISVVPKDAMAFYMTAGVRPLTIYDAILGLIREHLPDGAQHLQMWQAIQDNVGVDLRADLLSWLDGGAGWIALPGKRGGSTELVLYLRLLEEDAARRVLEGTVRKIRKFVESRGQAMEIVELPDSDGKFWEIQIGAFPWLRPVVGLPGGYAVLASSRDAVNRIMKTYSGEAPNFTKNPAYKAMELPEGPLVEVYYLDLKGSMEGVANLASGAGFVLSVLPNNYETRHARKLGAILTKLAVFIRAIDIGVFTGGWTRYEPEHHSVFSRMVSQIRPTRKF
jgi:hypothetical protein